jgi:hypothetical protein
VCRLKGKRSQSIIQSRGCIEKNKEEQRSLYKVEDRGLVAFLKEELAVQG